MKRKILITSLITLIFSSGLVYEVAAQETAIFFDDFESGSENWDLEDGWLIISEGENQILEGTEHSFATAFLDGVANKLELKLKLIRGSIHLNVRAKSVEGGDLRSLKSEG